MRMHRTFTNSERSPVCNRLPIVANKAQTEQQAAPGRLHSRFHDECVDTRIQARMLIAVRRQWAIIDCELERASVHAGGKLTYDHNRGKFLFHFALLSFQDLLSGKHY